MNKMRIWGWLSLLILPFFMALADADSARLSTNVTSLNLQVGQKATVQFYNASGKVRVSSANSLVAKAGRSDAAIKVEAKAAGSTVVTVRDNRSSVTVAVTVTATPAPTPTPATGLTANPTSLALAIGQQGYVQLANASGRLSASVQDRDIAKAELSGTTLKVKGRATGTTTITVRDRRYAVVIGVAVGAAGTPPGTPPAPGTPPTAGGTYTLLAWNDLGMHCMDGDFSVFSILPPYNNLHAQLVDSTSNKVVTSGVTLTYEAMADADGSINSISSTKTNFWQNALALFGVAPAADVGLAGNHAPAMMPHAMAFNAAKSQFEAEGIPITPYDDAFRKNPYPMVKVVARDGSGAQLAQARVVLPVSDEMSCSSCHAANASAAAKPAAGWLTDPNKEIEWKKNILRLHDEKQAGNSAFTSALAAKGYQPSGLLATAESGKSVLCAGCHASNALPGTGITGVKPLTEAIHGHHAMVRDAATGNLLDSITNRSACYQCHPGSETKCLRGVMGNAVDATGKATMDCQSCHGSMSNVGRAGRVGWLDQPNCQACHHDGKRETAAVSATGILKQWLDTRYATNPDTPLAGFSLFRMSKGHGGLQCEACHGATHAEYPSSHRNDNVLSLDVQGREGSIGECTACHKTVPTTANGGPHGMHTPGQAWVSSHESAAKGNQAACAYCHGADYRGTPLSATKVARTLTVEHTTKSFAAGHQFSCYDCHNGPSGD